MKKFKNILVGVIAAVTVVMCVALPVGAGDFSLRLTENSPLPVMTTMYAPGVQVYCKCASSSNGTVLFRLRYASGGSFLIAQSFTVGAGEDYFTTAIGLTSTTSWQLAVSLISGTTAFVSGYFGPYYGS